MRSANSEEIMQKARIPGKISRKTANRPPRAAARAWKPAMISKGPSTASAMTIREKNITGVRKKRVENGFAVAGWRRRRICVRPHRKPEKKADAMTRINPTALNAVSPATIMTTPTVIVAMITINLTDGVSRRKTKAKRRTNASADDLHMVRKVREMNFRDIFPRPISREVAAPQGTRRVR